MAKALSGYMRSALEYFNGDGVLLRELGGYWRNVPGPYVRSVTMIALMERGLCDFVYGRSKSVPDHALLTPAGRAALSTVTKQAPSKGAE